MQNCLEMERLLETEPVTSVVDIQRPRAAAILQTRSLVLRPEAVRIRRYSSSAEDDEAFNDATDTDRTRLTGVLASFDSDSGCGTSEPSSPTVTAASTNWIPAVGRSLSADAGVVVVMACRCVQPHPAKSRRCRSSSAESLSVADRLSDDVDGSRATERRCAFIGSRSHRCSFQGCRKMYTKRSHLKSHLRTHTGRCLQAASQEFPFFSLLYPDI